MNYSFIIPVHNEEKNLAPLMNEIEAVREKLDGASEVLFVNDGSTDQSPVVLEDLTKKFQSVRVITFEKNAGQSAAFSEGIKQAAGEVIITMDADLQNNPADVPHLLRYYPQFDVVIGRRIHRRDSLKKKFSSFIANAIRNRITDENIADTGCSLKIFKAAILKKVTFYNGFHRFLPTLCRMEGASVREVPVRHRSRVFGETHYGTKNRAFSAFIDALVVRWMMRRKLTYIVKKDTE